MVLWFLWKVEAVKTISTLVPDIYSLLESGKAKLDSSRLAEMIKKRLSPSESGPALRMSNLGEKCWRKLWYRQNMPDKAEPLPGHTVLKFLIGDIIEEVVLSLAEQAGHDVQGRQDTLELFGVPGHRDAIIDGVLTDVKSANSRGMDKFTNHRLEQDDPFGYLDQLNAYLDASRDVTIKGEAAFLAVDKELGHLVLDKYKKRDKPWKDIIQRMRAMLSSSEPPERAYRSEADGKSGNMKIPMPCSYCQFKNECYKDSNDGRGLRKFYYATGPRWLTRVVKTPEVPEDTRGSYQTS